MRYNGLNILRVPLFPVSKGLKILYANIDYIFNIAYKVYQNLNYFRGFHEARKLSTYFLASFLFLNFYS